MGTEPPSRLEHDSWRGYGHPHTDAAQDRGEREGPLEPRRSVRRRRGLEPGAGLLRGPDRPDRRAPRPSRGLRGALALGALLHLGPAEGLPAAVLLRAPQIGP